MGKTKTGRPYINIPAINSIAATVNNAGGAVSVTASFQLSALKPIMMNGIQITDRKGKVFPGYENYIRNVSWNATTGTLTFEITHFTEYGIPVLEGKTFTGAGVDIPIVAQGDDIVANYSGGSVNGDSNQTATTNVSKISGLAYETVLSDVPSTINNLYKPLKPGEEYGISFEYINRGNASDTVNIVLVMTSANAGHFGYQITEDTKSVEPWQVVSFDVKVNANGANAFERATLDATISLPDESAVSYNGFSGAYQGGSFGDDGEYGGTENMTHQFILEAEGFNLTVLGRSVSINSPIGNADFIPGAKITYYIAIKNNSTAVATSINLTDVIPPNCHLYYTVTPDVQGATFWSWQGATDNNKTSSDSDAVKYEITIPASGIVTASYTVTLD
jgi:uncharacterized repeat protein (TIGR01451 family)